MKNRLVIYIAGPYRAKGGWTVQENIERAASVAISVWQAGHIALCPHLNTAHFDGVVPDERFLEGDLRLLERCDAVLTVSGWQESDGAKAEVAHARHELMPVWHSIDELPPWK